MVCSGLAYVRVPGNRNREVEGWQSVEGSKPDRWKTLGLEVGVGRGSREQVWGEWWASGDGGSGNPF